MNKIVLDCSSFNSAKNSVAALFGVSSAKLLERLAAFNHDALSEQVRTMRPYEDLLIEHAFGLRSEELPAPLITHWFHATRVSPSTTFQDGILPLSQILDGVWQFLGELALDWTTLAEWQVFRGGMHGQFAEQYGRKISAPLNEGPFAFLVRDVVLLRDQRGANHDFLGVPELVEDICLSYQEMNGHPLLERFTQATRPCIVTFKSAVPRANALKAAIMYIDRRSKGQKLGDSCNTCFSGEGSAVPPKDIVAVEWVKLDA